MMSPKPQACSFPHLDLLRACSCLIVFTVHFQIIADKTALPWKYAHGSVIIFFVLSGYLISLSIANTASFWQYLRKRSLRIYSVYAPALICSLLICDIGLIDTHSLKLLFFYDSPSLSHQVNNQPIWSLSFEVHYYLVFGVASYLKRGAIFTFILASFFLPVDTLILFPCWLSGVALRCLKRNEWSYKLNICLMLVSSSSLVVIYNKNLPLHDWIMTKQWQLYDLFLSPIDLGYARYFLLDWAASCFVIALIYSMSALQIPRRLSSISKWISMRSFSIYICHYPIFSLFSEINFMRNQELIAYASTLAICIVFSEIFEIKVGNLTRQKSALTSPSPTATS